MPPTSQGSSILAFTFLLLVGVIISGFVVEAGTASELETTAADQPSDADEELSLDKNISMIADLRGNGDARWTISTTFDLKDENETKAFEELADDFENGDISQLGVESFETAAESVNRHTEREMAIQNIQLRSSSQQETKAGTGELSVIFTWENFARTDENRLVIDDVLTTETGDIWLEGLYDTQSLIIAAPPGFGVKDANVGAQNGELHWEGPQSFDQRSLQATFIGPSSNGDNQNESNDNGDEPDEAGLALLWLLVPIVLIGSVIIAYVARIKGVQINIPRAFGTGTDEEKTEEADPTAATETASKSASTDETGDTETTTGSETATSGENESTKTESTEMTMSDENDNIDEELLSDEERVERLLSENGGRMKQANIVKETDWSNAKVSQLLSSMEEDGRIDKLRIGRENLISFPDEDITNSEE